MTMSTTPSTQLAALAERYWQFECEETPLAAVLAGVPLQADAIFRESAADWSRRDQGAALLLDELDTVPEAKLAGQERATHRLLRRELEAVRTQYAVRVHERPWLLPLGPDFMAVYWANSTAITDAASAELYVRRLRTLPGYLADVRTNIEAGRRRGVRYPAAVLSAAVQASRGLSGPAGDSPFQGPFKRSAARDHPAVAAQAKLALNIVEVDVLPAQQAFTQFLEAELAHHARATFGCADAPDGRDYYAAMVRYFTTTTADPASVHAMGLGEVARLEAEIDQVAADAGWSGDVPGYRQFLTTDLRFVATSAEELRTSIESLCKRIDRKIPAYFGRLPRITYGVDSISPGLSVTMPPAYAQPSPADRSAAGVFWVSGLPAKCPSYIHVPMAVHEAWPGHLMHIALLQEATDLPTFRRFGSVKYTACIEGWALYCESLGVEMGLYDTPEQHYGRLEMELWRAIRLVLDTGIHWHGWTREQSIAYMSERLTHSRETIEAEVDRYAAMPGQALGYQIGNLAMRALRRKAEQQLGDRFTHRAFHEAVMTSGAVTLPVLEGLVDEWLAQQMDSSAVAA